MLTLELNRYHSYSCSSSPSAHRLMLWLLVAIVFGMIVMVLQVFLPKCKVAGSGVCDHGLVVTKATGMSAGVLLGGF